MIKKTSMGFAFYAIEVLTFLSQFVTFFFVTFIMSGMFENEKRLISFVESKFNVDSAKEFSVTIVALIFVMGLFSTARYVISSPLIDKILDELIFEFPKTIYLFGSSSSSLMASVAIFIYNNPATSEIKPVKFVGFAVFFSVSFLFFGILLKSILIKKRNLEIV